MCFLQSKEALWKRYKKKIYAVHLKSMPLLWIRIRMFLTVLWTRDISVRIRIRGYVPLTNGSGSCYFRHCPSRRKFKSHTEVTKHRNQGFFYYFCLMIEGSGSWAVARIQKAHKHTAPDLNLQHWFLASRIRIRHYFARIWSSINKQKE